MPDRVWYATQTQGLLYMPLDFKSNTLEIFVVGAELSCLGSLGDKLYCFASDAKANRVYVVRRKS